MRFVSKPSHLPLFAGPCLWVIGGTHDALTFAGLRAGPPLGLASRQIVVLLPHLSQELHTGFIHQSGRRVGALQGLQQLQPIRPDLLGQGCALAFGGWRKR